MTVLDFVDTIGGVRVVFSLGAVRSIPAELAHLETERALLVSTPGRGGEVATVREAIGSAVIGVFDRARLHVPRTVVNEALRMVAGADPDVLVAVGGGAAIGVAKAVALEADLPIVAVPTTYAGSEMTPIWGISDGDEKRTGRDERVAPKSVIYDPRLTLTLPPAVSAASGMNALAHCVEALYAVDGSPLVSDIAEDGARRLAMNLPRIVEDPRDESARAHALLGAHLAGRALGLTSMGLHHKLCHVLGGTFSMSHALVHAVVLPYVVAFNAGAAPNAIRRLARALDVNDAVTGIVELNRRLGNPASLRELGLHEKDLPVVATRAAASGYPNPRTVTAEAVLALLERAYTGLPPVPAP